MSFHGLKQRKKIKYAWKNYNFFCSSLQILSGLSKYIYYAMCIFVSKKK